MSGTGFVYSNEANRFTATGCDNYAMLVQDGETVGGCLSICRNDSNTRGCYGLNCCQATIPPNIQSFEANMTDLSGEIDCIGRKSAFMVHQDLFELRSLDEMLQMDHVPARIEWAKFKGNCDLSETITPYINCTSDSKYCWAQINTRQLCICRNCQGTNSHSALSDYLD